MLFWDSAVFVSGARCQNALCPDTFKGKSITFIFQWIEFIKSHPYILEPSRESFSVAVNENKGKRWKESSFKENKKASTKKCINVESGKKGALYLELEWRRWKAQWANSLPLLISKFGGKSFLKVPWTKLTARSLKYSHNVSIFWGSRRIPVGKFYMYNRLSVMCLFQGKKHIRNNLETSHYFGFIWCQSTDWVDFYHKWPMFKLTGWWICINPIQGWWHKELSVSIPLF